MPADTFKTGKYVQSKPRNPPQDGNEVGAKGPLLWTLMQYILPIKSLISCGQEQNAKKFKKAHPTILRVKKSRKFYSALTHAPLHTIGVTPKRYVYSCTLIWSRRRHIRSAD